MPGVGEHNVMPAVRERNVYARTTYFGERLGGRIRASKPDHLMACRDQLLNNRGAYKSCSARDECTHR
jgi:hypothetical protein